MMNTEDCKEMNIYANREEINSHDVCRATEDTRNNQTFQHTGSETVRNRSHRSVLVCLVVLCVLLLTTVIVLCVLTYTNNHQFINNNKNITQDRDQLLSNYINITEDRDELTAKFNNITKLYEELRTRVYDGWIYYKFSLYFISSEKKNWTDSRRYCRERGANLIIINNKEEQDFVKKYSGSEKIWIGLTDSEVEGRWKWVDGRTPTSSFWGSVEPNGQGRENCVLTDPSVWADFPCNEAFKWICEKNIINVN